MDLLDELEISGDPRPCIELKFDHATSPFN
jgi:hypothetical protein